MKFDIGLFRDGQQAAENGKSLKLFILVFDGGIVDEGNDDAANAGTFASGEEPLHFLGSLFSFVVGRAEEGAIHEVVGTNRANGNAVLIAEGPHFCQENIVRKRIYVLAINVEDPFNGVQTSA